MIKAIAGDMIILGFSQENIKRLMDGKPISFEGSQVGIEGKRVLIVYGETEIQIIHDLQEAISEKAHSLP
jgi:hypothetical protein